jgi:hypothetical protein
MRLLSERPLPKHRLSRRLSARTGLAWALLALALAQLSGCAEGEGESRELVRTRLYHRGGEGIPEVFPPAVTLRVIAAPASGDDPTPLAEVRWPLSDGAGGGEGGEGGALPTLPEDTPLLLLFEGLDGGGEPVFSGGVGPLVVPKVARDAVDFVVFLSRVGDINPAMALGSEGAWGVAALEDGIGRAGAAAVTLTDGRALVIGGGALDAQGLPQSATDRVIVYEPRTGRFTVAKDEAGDPLRLSAARALHTATRFADGRVLVAGGYALIDGQPQALRSAEWIAPAARGGFVRIDAQPMAEARARHTATLRVDQSLIIAGGERRPAGGAVEVAASVEVFSPVTGAFVLAAMMGEGRTGHAALLMPDGEEVLLAGGMGEVAGEVKRSVEAFRVSAAGQATVQPWADLLRAREGFGAISFEAAGGRYAAFVGGRGADGAAVAEVELWDVRARALITTATLDVPRADFAWALAGDGYSAAVLGGLDTARQPQTSAEWLHIDAASGVFSVRLLGAKLSKARAYPAAARLASGLVLVVGGQEAVGAPLDSVDALNAGLPSPWASAPPDP